MNKTERKLKKLEKSFAQQCDKKFGGLKKWIFFGDMTQGHLTIVITAKEKP